MTDRRLRLLCLVLLLMAIGSGLAWADDLPIKNAKWSWNVDWDKVWELMKNDVKSVFAAFVVCFTVGVQILFFPLYYYAMKFHPSSSMRLAYWAATIVFLGVFIRIYWLIIALIWLSYWCILIELFLLCILVYWLVVLPKKVMT